MNHPSPAEQDIIRRARQGDDEAFEQLIMRFTPAIFRVVRRMTSDSQEAEAIVQETFLRVWQALPRYKDDRPFFPYLVTIATNIYRDQWRKSKRLDFGGLEPLDESMPNKALNPEQTTEQREILQALADAVSELPPPYRTVIALRYDANLKYQEIAEVLDIPINTVRTHLRRAKMFLKDILTQSFMDDEGK